MATPPVAERTATREFEIAVDVAFCAIRDEGAGPDVEVTVDADGSLDVAVDIEPLLECGRRAIIAAGLDVDIEAVAEEAVEQHRELDNELTYGAYLGETHKADYRAARAAYDRPPPQRRPERSLPMIAPNCVDAGAVLRMTGRAPRLPTNQRARGSRRSTTTSAGGGDSGDESDPANAGLEARLSDDVRECPDCRGPLLRGGTRGPWPPRCADCKRDREREQAAERQRRARAKRKGRGWILSPRRSYRRVKAPDRRQLPHVGAIDYTANYCNSGPVNPHALADELGCGKAREREDRILGANGYAVEAVAS